MRSPEWEFGVTRLFGNLQRGSLVSGWSEPEDEHVWNNGPEAVQHILIPRSYRPLAVSLECLPFIGGSCKLQDITLYVNGIRVKFWRLRTSEIHHLEATIPPHCVAESGETVLLKCSWYLPCSISPQAAGIGGDGRELGLCFRALTISEINLDETGVS